MSCVFCAVAAGEAALDEVDRLEAQLTVYRDTSEVSRLNARAATGPVPVEEGLFDLLQLAGGDRLKKYGAAAVAVLAALVLIWALRRRR